MHTGRGLHSADSSRRSRPRPGSAAAPRRSAPAAEHARTGRGRDRGLRQRAHRGRSTVPLPTRRPADRLSGSHCVAACLREGERGKGRGHPTAPRATPAVAGAPDPVELLMARFSSSSRCRQVHGRHQLLVRGFLPPQRMPRSRTSQRRVRALVREQRVQPRAGERVGGGAVAERVLVEERVPSLDARGRAVRGHGDVTLAVRDVPGVAVAPADQGDDVRQRRVEQDGERPGPQVIAAGA